MDELVKIDIKFFTRNGEYILCPSLQRRKNPYPENSLYYHGFDWMKYMLFKLIRLRFIRNLLPEDRVPLSLLFNVTSWWAPAHMFEKFLMHPDFKVCIPEKWEEYLRFRYGNWKTPVHNWDYTRDDGGYSHKSPVDLVRQFFLKKKNGIESKVSPLKHKNRYFFRLYAYTGWYALHDRK